MLKNITLINIFGFIICESNNVCKTFEDYDHKENNSNCYVNYSVNYLVPDVIKKYGYPFEKHTVQTKDGYVLTMHRISNRGHRKMKTSPVFLFHGMICASSVFTSNGKDSLAFVLADQGFDVWMGNQRGNIYSNRHQNFTTKNTEYWDFNIDHLAMVDFPLYLKYISNTTLHTGKIILIGHSLGAMLPLMYASEEVEEAKLLIKNMFLMSTADSMIHSKCIGMAITRNFGLNHVLSQFLGLDQNQLSSFGIYVPGPMKQSCLVSSLSMKTCFETGMTFIGRPNSIKPDVFPQMLRGIGVGTSLKVIQQMVSFLSHTLSKFDYGYPGNIVKYGQKTPPEYMLEKVQIPTYIYCAKNDWLLDIEDSKHLYNRLTPSIRKGFYIVPSENFNHADFIFGSTAKKLVYDRIIRMINRLP